MDVDMIQPYHFDFRSRAETKMARHGELILYLEKQSAEATDVRSPILICI